MHWVCGAYVVAVDVVVVGCVVCRLRGTHVGVCMGVGWGVSGVVGADPHCCPWARDLTVVWG